MPAKSRRTPPQHQLPAGTDSSGRESPPADRLSLSDPQSPPEPAFSDERISPNRRRPSRTGKSSQEAKNVAEQDSPSPEPSSAEEDSGSKEEPSAEGKPRRKRRRRWIIIGVIVLVAAGVGVWLYYWYSSFYESTDDAYIDGNPVGISARVSGNIVNVYVVDNLHVAQGTLLVEIDPCDYQVRLAEAEAAVRAAQADEEQAVADVNVAGADLKRQREDLKRYETLAKQGAATVQTLQHYQASFDVAQAQLNAAQKHLAAVRAQIAQQKAMADQARLELSYTRVHAPQAGYVTKKTVEKGSYVSVGQPLMDIVTDEMWVTANFKETQLTHMRPGQPATIIVDAYPRLVLKGRVQSIQAGTGAVFSLFPPENATGNFVKVVQRVPVRITFQKPSDPNYFLALGMSVEPKVTVK